jgi:hypothetical protein
MNLLKQFPISSAYLKSSHGITQFLAVGTLAIGISTVIASAPAQAVVLNTGELSFSDGTANFFEGVTPGSGDTFSVTFNPTQVALVTGASDSFSSFFPVTSINYTLAPSTGNFSYLSSSGNTFDYQLTNNLDFSFTNGVKLTVGAGSIFRGLFTNADSVVFGSSFFTGSTFSNAGDVTGVNSLSFGFTDNRGGIGGGYNIVASPVPEPFTVIGSIIGGTAAFRMRKKLTASKK